MSGLSHSEKKSSNPVLDRGSNPPDRQKLARMSPEIWQIRSNRFGWGNTAKAQKVETSIEVRIAYQARLNFVNVEINVLLGSQKLVTSSAEPTGV
jgi:hypothetical protein